MTAERVRDPERTAVDRRWTRRTYQVAAVVCLVAVVQAVIVLAVGGTALLWAVAPALLVAAIVLAYKSIPYDHVTFPRGPR